MADEMTRQERACEIMRRLGKLYPKAHIALGFDTPWHLLVAVILSAQTTDAGVNKVTPVLFACFPGAEELAGGMGPEDGVARHGDGERDPDA